MNVDEAKALNLLRSGMASMICPECREPSGAMEKRPFGGGQVYHLHCSACGHNTASETSVAALVNKYGRMKGLPDGKAELKKLQGGKEVIATSFIAEDDLDPHAPAKNRNKDRQERTVMVPVGREQAVVLASSDDEPESEQDTFADLPPIADGWEEKLIDETAKPAPEKERPERYDAREEIRQMPAAAMGLNVHSRIVSIQAAGHWLVALDSEGVLRGMRLPADPSDCTDLQWITLWPVGE